MQPDRLNAFTDAFVAIIITIMVLEIRLPEVPSFEGFRTMLPILGIYALSFVNIGILWANHHHMMQVAASVDGRVIWANLMLLFWLSLIPYEIRWMGEAGIVTWPVAAYAGVLFMAALAYLMLERALTAVADPAAELEALRGARLKEWLSLVFYALALATAFLAPYLAVAICFAVVVMWLIPNRRFEEVKLTTAGGR